MQNEEKFKQNLNSKLEELHFPFDESNWPGAEALLDADKKRSGGLYYLIPLLMLLGGLSVYWLWPQNAAGKDKEKMLSRVEASQPNEEKLVPLDKPTTSNVIREKAALILTKQKEKTQIRKYPVLKDKPINISEYGKQNPKSETSISKLEQVPNQTENPVIENTSTLKNENNNLPTTNIGITINENEIQNFPLPIKQMELPPVLQPSVASQAQSTIGNKEESEQIKETISKGPIAIESPIKIGSNQTENLPADKPEFKNTEVLSTIQTNSSSSLTDTLKENVTATELNTPSVVANANSFLFLELGGAYNLGYKNPGSTDGNGFNPVFGIQWMSVIRNKFSFSFGFQYQPTGHLKYSRHLSKVTRYGLGEDSYVTVITPTTAHYLYMPFRINYRVKEKNIFSLGCNIGYLMNVTSKVENYNEHFNSINSYKTYSTAGYTEGFALFESQLAFAYRRRLYSDFWLSSEIFLGLTDIKNNTFFNTSVYERNSGIKFILIYQLFKK